MLGRSRGSLDQTYPPVYGNSDRHCGTEVSSPRGSATRSGSAGRGLLSRPLLDLRPEPKLRAATAEIEHRTRHIGISVLVDAHRARVREAEDLGDITRVNKVFGGNGWRHSGRGYPFRRIRPTRVLV